MAEDDYVGLHAVEHVNVRVLQLVKLAEDVPYQNGMTCQLLNRLGREMVEPVVVAFDGDDRRYLFEPADHFQLPYVARVYDRIDAIKQRENGVVKHPVCV